MAAEKGRIYHRFELNNVLLRCDKEATKSEEFVILGRLSASRAARERPGDPGGLTTRSVLYF